MALRRPGLAVTFACLVVALVCFPQASAIHRVLPQEVVSKDGDIALHHPPQYPVSESHEAHHHSAKPLDFSILNSLVEEDEEDSITHTSGDEGGGMRFRELMGTEATVDARTATEATIGGMGLHRIDKLTDGVVNSALRKLGMEEPIEDEKELTVVGSQDRFRSVDHPMHPSADAFYGKRSNRAFLQQRSATAAAAAAATHADRKHPRAQRPPVGVLVEERAATDAKRPSSEAQPVAFVETDAHTVADGQVHAGLAGKDHGGVRKVRRKSAPSSSTDTQSSSPALAEEQAHVTTHTHMNTHSDTRGKSRAELRRERRERAKPNNKNKATAGDTERVASDVSQKDLEHRKKPQPSHTDLFSAIRKHINNKVPSFDPQEHRPFADMPRTNTRYVNKNARFAEVLRRMGTGAGEGEGEGAAFEYKPSPFKHPPPPPVPPPPPPPPPPDFGPGSEFSGYQFGTVGGAAPASAASSFSSLWEKTYPEDSPFHHSRDPSKNLPRFVQEQLAQDSAHTVLLEEAASARGKDTKQPQQAPRAHRDFVASRIPHPEDYMRLYADYAHVHYPALRQYVLPIH